VRASDEDEAEGGGEDVAVLGRPLQHLNLTAIVLLRSNCLVRLLHLRLHREEERRRERRRRRKEEEEEGK
jgi:hypothetical protein